MDFHGPFGESHSCRFANLSEHMSARFAGARSLGDRRRRRLAQDADRKVAEPTARRSPARSAAAQKPVSEQPADAAPSRLTLQPRDSLIPYTPWKVWAIASASLSVWGLMLWMGQSNQVQPAFHEIVKLENGPFARFFSTLCLLATTQLSAIILWHRIRSKKDFSGRYRVWFLATGFWALNTFCLTTGTHLVWSRSLLQQFPIDMWHAETFCWLIPNTVAYLAVHRLLQMEMHLSRASRLVWDAAWWAAATAAFLLMVPAAILAPAWYVPLFVGSSTLWQLLSAIALLAHARFVIHITNEAAPRKPPRLVRAMRTAHTAAERIAKVMPRPSFLSRSSTATDSTADAEVVPPAAAPAKESAAPRKGRAEQPKPTEAAKPAPAAVKPAPEPVKPPKPAAVEPKPEPKKVEPPSASAPVASQPAKTNVRFDPPQSVAPVSSMREEDDESEEDDDDDVDTSNLSRKERRRLKKQARQRR